MLKLGILAETGWESWWRLVTLQDYNTRIVLLGTVVIGFSSGLLGVYLLLRRRALIGDAISHAALPGVALAYLWTTAIGVDKSLPVLLLGAAISGGLGGATVLALRHLVKLREDASLGIVLSVFFGAGIALLAIAQRRGNAAGLEAFIYGKAASMTEESVVMALGVAVVVVGVLALCAKELRLLCFDSQLAASQGWPVLLLDSLLIGLVVGVTIVGLQAVGLILSIALLVVPAASARFWTHSLPRMLWVSAAFGCISCSVGTLLSAAVDKLPSGATIVLVACGIFGFSFAFGFQRGVVWRATRMWELRREYNFQHLLRAAYEILESRGVLPGSLQELKSTQPISLADICRLRGWSPGWTRKLAGRMVHVDLVTQPAADAIQLTPRGVVQAMASVRDHRLLEAYLVEEAEAKVSEADRAADYLEHGLQPEHLAELASILDAEFGRPLPPSLHRILPEPGPGEIRPEVDGQEN